MLLYDYWRSGAAYRVRIALNLKHVDYERAVIDLRGGEQRGEEYRTLQPQGLVPALQVEDHTLIQSPAILEWLEETYPSTPLLPAAPADRATVRAMAAIVGCDIHPINNLRILNSLRQDLNASADQVDAWITRWIGAGFEALEVMIAEHGGAFAFGDTPTLADIYLVPQVYSANRFKVDLAPYARIRAVTDHARAQPAFAKAAPEAQPDADPS